MKIYVLGDYGLDNYLIGRVRGISAEVPIPVITVSQKVTLPAMAGNVVVNLQSLAPVGVEIVELRSGDDITTHPIKNRLVTEDGHQLARWDECDNCEPYTVGDLVPLMNADAVVVSDYGKGSITPQVAQILGGISMPLFVDTKSDPSMWAGTKAILFPNLLEFHQYLTEYQQLPRVVLKMGRQGAAYVSNGEVVDSRPSLATFTQCVNGAGDTVLASFTLAHLQGMSIPNSLVFSQTAAAEVVEQPVLNRVTTPEAIYERLLGYEAVDVIEESPVSYIYHYTPSDGPVN